MILIVGLGNPGKKYQKTRHNIGFRVIDKLESLNLKKVILAKPKTFMNQSGVAVKKIIKNYKLEIRNLIVVHDDLDLPLGKIRIVKNRGPAGHKGVESIIEELGTKNFIRFRIGIQPKGGKPKNVEKFVLQKPSEAGDETKSQRSFNKNEEKITKEVIKKTAEAIDFSLKHGLEKAMSKFNK